MKARSGFVSNSSSASFVVLKEGLTAIQAWQVAHHIEVSNQAAGYELNDPGERWSIRDEEDRFECSTYMDNFDLREFLRVIGVPDECVTEEHYG